MISDKAFKALKSIDYLGYNNSVWGVVEDSNKSNFVSSRDFPLDGRWLYVYVSKNEDIDYFDDPDQFIYDSPDIILLYRL